MTDETKSPNTNESKPAGLTEIVKPPFNSIPQVAKEVKPVAEVKDPMGMFDYTGCKVHEVQDGDSLFEIAQKNHVALQQLRYFNHVNKATFAIRKNQKIYIPKETVWIKPGE